MPNQPKTPHRTIRIDDALWNASQRKAQSEGRTISDVIRQALRKYIGKGE